MRKFNVTVNGKSYSVEVEEEGGMSVSSSAPIVAAPVSVPVPVKTAAPAGGTAVNSPMPGLILKLNVANGAVVKKGSKILVLEAMKMENDIVANADGVITYLVKQGDTVETGSQLASIK